MLITVFKNFFLQNKHVNTLTLSENNNGLTSTSSFTVNSRNKKIKNIAVIKHCNDKAQACEAPSPPIVASTTIKHIQCDTNENYSNKCNYQIINVKIIIDQYRHSGFLS